MTKNLSSDPHWKINENYFSNMGPINISPHMPNQTLAQYIGSQTPTTPNDLIKVANLSDPATASEAANAPAAVAPSGGAVAAAAAGGRRGAAQ